MFNDPTDWENGAFSRNATGHPDYGWGIYNMATHVLTGDSIYIIQLVDGSFKKLWIVEKNSPANEYTFRYANLDGADSQEVTMDCGLYTEKEFVGFNMQLNLPVDYQPDKEEWDVLFTKYMSIQPNGDPYVVTGILGNPEIYTKRYHPVAPDFNDWQVAPWDSSRSNIGWDWKVFDMNQFIYIIQDSMVYYVKDHMGSVYRLVFTGFDGMSTGDIRFEKAGIEAAGIGDRKDSNIRISIWPNPATDFIQINIETLVPVREPVLLTIMDMMGRTVTRETVADGQQRSTLDIQSLAPGAYLIMVSSGTDQSLYKILKN